MTPVTLLVLFKQGMFVKMKFHFESFLKRFVFKKFHSAFILACLFSKYCYLKEKRCVYIRLGEWIVLYVCLCDVSLAATAGSPGLDPGSVARSLLKPKQGENEVLLNRKAAIRRH